VQQVPQFSWMAQVVGEQSQRAAAPLQGLGEGTYAGKLLDAQPRILRQPAGGFRHFAVSAA